MPIYEYRCSDCGKTSAHLLIRRDRADSVHCPHCGGSRLERLMSRFAAPRSEEARLDAIADAGSFLGLDESDPRSMARFMKRMGEDLGEEFEEALGPPEDAPPGADLDDQRELAEPLD